MRDLIANQPKACPQVFTYVAERDSPPRKDRVRRVKGGYVERVKLQHKESRTRRRFSLTEKYHHTRRRMLTGFFPEDRSVEEASIAQVDDSVGSNLPDRSSSIRRYARDYSTIARLRRLGIEE
jgi:hypothetical protein